MNNIIYKIFAQTGAVTVLSNEARFLRIWVIFWTSYLRRNSATPQFFTFLTWVTHNLKLVRVSEKKSVLEDFCANGLKMRLHTGYLSPLTRTSGCTGGWNAGEWRFNGLKSLRSWCIKISDESILCRIGLNHYIIFAVYVVRMSNLKEALSRMRVLKSLALIFQNCQELLSSAFYIQSHPWFFSQCIASLWHFYTL